MAWLNATPKPDERSKAAKPEFERPQLSRIEQYRRDGLPVFLPPNPAPSIVNHLVEMGITEAGGMGAVPLSWATIDAWQRVTGVTLPAWEARMIRQLSVEYLSETRKAESQFCPAPWQTEPTQRHREAEMAHLKATFGIE